MLAIFTKTSSVTKRNIVDRMDKVLGMAYTPHQCSYSDRNDPHWEKNLQFGRMGSKYVQNIVKHSLWTVVKALHVHCTWVHSVIMFVVKHHPFFGLLGPL